MYLLVVEDEYYVREGIISLIDFEALGIDGVFEAKNGLEALEQVACHLPELVVADINMPFLDGLSFIREAKRTIPRAQFAILSGYDSFEYAQQAIKLGVQDYILKPVKKSEIEYLLKRMVTKASEVKQNRRIEELLEKQRKEASLETDLFKALESQIYSSDSSLTRLALLLGFNANYLSALVKQEFGISFQDYVSQRRIEKAKLLLLSTDLKVYEIAHKVGFEDTSYFSSRFKQITSQSPLQFREKG